MSRSGEEICRLVNGNKNSRPSLTRRLVPLPQRPLQPREVVFNLRQSLIGKEKRARVTVEGQILHVDASLLRQPSHAVDPPAADESLGNADLVVATADDTASEVHSFRLGQEEEAKRIALAF